MKRIVLAALAVAISVGLSAVVPARAERGTLATAAAGELPATTGWRSPSDDILEVLHAPELPRVWTAPTGEHLLLADPVT